jgi:creatinine amidohydrolase/Fe(II)-dependent formamide hydrolase-like protein
MDKPILYEDLTLDKVVRLAKTRGIIIVPAATTEGHGYHLPMGTDTFVAEWISAELSKITGLPTLMPTPIRCGCSPTFHYDLNGDPMLGTLAIGHDTMHNLCKDLCRGLWTAGFRKIIFVQGHGQEWNFQTIAHEVATELRREGKALFIAAATYWELAAETIRQEISAPFWHAGEWETSAMMFAKPDLVKFDGIEGMVRVPLIDRDLIKGSVAQDNTETYAVQDVASWVNIPEPDEVHDWGVGTKEQIQSATAEKGKKVLMQAMERYLALIRDLEMHYAPHEVPGVDVRKRPAKPRFEVNY